MVSRKSTLRIATFPSYHISFPLHLLRFIKHSLSFSSFQLFLLLSHLISLSLSLSHTHTNTYIFSLIICVRNLPFFKRKESKYSFFLDFFSLLGKIVSLWHLSLTPFATVPLEVRTTLVVCLFASLSLSLSVSFALLWPNVHARCCCHHCCPCRCLLLQTVSFFHFHYTCH